MKSYLFKIMLISFILISCNKDKKQISVQDSKSKYGGSYVINILRGSPNALDPVLINSKHADDISSQIYDRLIDLNEKLILVPELTKSLPTISDDGLKYIFNLRTDVYFHDNKCFQDGKGRKNDSK